MRWFLLCDLLTIRIAAVIYDEDLFKSFMKCDNILQDKLDGFS